MFNDSILLLSAVLAVVPCLSASKTQVEVIYEDQFGIPIDYADVRVTVVRLRDQRDFSARLKDGRGKLPNGWYDLTIDAFGFLKFERRLALDGGKRIVFARLILGRVAYTVLDPQPTRLVGSVVANNLPANELLVRIVSLDGNGHDLEDYPVAEDLTFEILEWDDSYDKLLLLFHRMHISPEPDDADSVARRGLKLLHAEQIRLQGDTTRVVINLEEERTEPIEH